MDFYSNLNSRSLQENPTLFEIISSNELEALLTPSIRYVLVNFVARYPNRHTLKLSTYFDEINLLLRGLVEYNHLKNWNTTFIDKFYGLKKIYVHQELQGLDSKSVQMEMRLNKRQIWILLFQAVGLPYLREKLDILHAKWHSQNAFGEEELTAWQQKFVEWYPRAKMMLSIANLLLCVNYLGGKSSVTSVIDLALGVEYARMGQFDYDLDAQRNARQRTVKLNRRREVNRTMLVQRSRDILSHVKAALLAIGGKVFPVGIFMLKFLEWWNSSDVISNLYKKTASLDDPLPPPPTDRTDYQSGKVCYLCDDVITNPAMIETGYVFCYPCIMRHLADPENEGKCPITDRKLPRVTTDEKGNVAVDGVRKLML